MRARPIIKPRCLACRRKKIKCDYQKPTCGRCAHTGTQCEYQNDMVFVNFSSQSAQQLHKSQISSPSRPETDYAVAVRGRQHRGTIDIRWMPAAATNRNSLTDGFLLRYYPTDTKWWRKVCSWVFPALDGQQYNPLKTASLALSSAMMGTSTQNEGHKQYSVRCYIQSMQQLRVSCQHPKEGDWFNALLTSLLLFTFGSMHPIAIDVEGMMGHCVGLASIVQMAGPAAFHYGHKHQALLYVRLLLFSMAEESGVPCFLAEPDWMTIPFLKQPKNDLHQALDFLAGVPALKQRCLKLIANGRETANGNIDSNTSVTDVSVATEQLLTDIMHLSDSVEEWYSAICERLPTIFQKDLQARFTNVGDSGVAIGCNTVRLSLHDMVWQLCEAHPASDAIVLREVLQVLEGRARPAAKSNFQLISYWMHPDQGTMGCGFIYRPLALSLRFYQHTQDEKGMAECAAQYQAVGAVAL